MRIQIGPVHIADAEGTHEPGSVLDNPTPALVELARAETRDPESGLLYAFDPDAVAPTPGPARAAKPAPAPPATTADTREEAA